MFSGEHSVSDQDWTAFEAAHRVGDQVEGEVVAVVPFGAFVRIGGTVDGLAPKAAWPSLPAVGDQVRGRIEALDPAGRRFSLTPVAD